MKFYNVTVDIQKMGTKVIKLSENQLAGALAAWKNKRSVNLPPIGLIRGRSITRISHEEIVEEVKDAE